MRSSAAISRSPHRFRSAWPARLTDATSRFLRRHSLPFSPSLAARDDFPVMDLPAAAFLRLRQHFFDAAGRPIPFPLREKRNTQDDPFGEFLVARVLADLPAVSCVGAPAVVTPDLVLFRSDLAIDRTDDARQIAGIEVKKLARTRGAVARASGVDFNTTPPCGRIRIYDANDSPMDVRGFYLFVCIEPAEGVLGSVVLSCLALVDGNFLNEDFEYYLSITGQREKRIGLGTFSDGADRQRPMLIFPNPLRRAEFDHSATLVHSDPDLSSSQTSLTPRFRLGRRVPSTGEVRTFIGYRHTMDAAAEPPTDILDPFPTPRRTVRTAPRGRFRLPFAF